MNDASWLSPAFPKEEYERRLGDLRVAMDGGKMDAMICLSPELINYYTGYDGCTYMYDQAFIYLANTDESFLVLADIDIPLADGTVDLAFVDHLIGFRIAVEDSVAHICAAIGAAPNVGLEDARVSPRALVIERLKSSLELSGRVLDGTAAAQAPRLQKSALEWGYVEQAATLAEIGYSALRRGLVPGATEFEVAAGLEVAMRRGGSEPPGIPTLFESGPRTVAPHSNPTGRVLRMGDAVRCGFAAVRRRYHVTTYQAFHLGQPSREFAACFAAAAQAQAALVAAARAGASISEVSRGAESVMREHGISGLNQGRFGYGVGLAYVGDWGEPLSVYEGSPMELKEDMQLCLHVTIADSERGFGFTVGADYRVGVDDARLVNRRPPELVVID